MIMSRLTALATLPLVAIVVALLALLAFTSDARAGFLGECPAAFDTQDVCYINTASPDDITVPDGRVLNTSAHGNPVVIYPVDGCASFVSGFADVMAGTMSPQECFAPLRFSVGDTNYCIQDNQAHTWQLCSTPDDMTTAGMGQTETQQPPETAATNPDWQRNCGSRSPGVYGTAASPLLCWADVVGGNLGGDTDPWSTTSWDTFTDCTPEGCRTYN